MKYKEHKIFSEDQDDASIKIISDVVKNFDVFDGGEGERNTIKNVDTHNLDLNIKSFKVPHLVNRIAYSFFRKSKANRSYEYASTLLKLGVNTPKPLAYFEFTNFNFLNKSYYVSKQLHCDLTYRELTNNLNYPDYDTILREFTRFTFDLHEKGINFLDHSPGNTLIKKNESTGKYDFYLVDLNRMQFHTMSFEDRMKNFAKLTSRKEMVEVMSNEYAKLVNESEEQIFSKMWSLTEQFQKKYHKKSAIKKNVFFWKKRYRNC
tara:strand:- start:6901 stop:7689 length:789 start_codon:yes stop_codon:yes gene_type:complete